MATNQNVTIPAPRAAGVNPDIPEARGSGMMPDVTGMVLPQARQPERSLIDRMFGSDLSAITDIGSLVGASPAIYAGTQGAIAGAPLGPAGTFVLGTLGTIVGTYAGENLRQVFMGESDTALAIDKATTAGWFEMLGPAATQTLKIAKLAMEKSRIGVKNLTGEEIQAIQELSTLMDNFKSGLKLTPAQMTGSGFFQALENYGAAGFFSGKYYDDLYRDQRDFLVNYFDTQIMKVGDPDARLTGEMFQDAVNQGMRDLRAWAKPRYQQLEDMAGDNPIDISDIVNSAKAQVTKSYRSTTKGGKSTLSAKTLAHLEEMSLKRKDNTFGGLFDTIDDLNATLRELQKPGAGKAADERAVAAITATRDALEKRMEEVAKASNNTEMLELYKTTSGIYKDGMTAFKNSSVDAAVRVDPEFAGQVIAQHGAVTSVEAAFKAVDDIAKYRELRLDQILTMTDKTKQEGELLLLAEELGVQVFNKDKNMLIQELRNAGGEAIKNNLRAGYMESLLQGIFKGQVTDADTARTALTALANIKADPARRRTFEAMLTEDQQNALFKGLEWANKMEKAAVGNYTLMVRGQQSRGARSAYAAFTTSTSGGVGYFDPIIGASLGIAQLVAPGMIARRATNGTWSNALEKKLTGFVTEYNAGRLDLQGLASLYSYLGANALVGERVPPEYGEINIPANVFYESVAAQLRLQAIGAQLPD